MRAASVGVDGVLRDSDGAPIERRRPVRRAAPAPMKRPGLRRGHARTQDVISSFFRSPYLAQMDTKAAEGTSAANVVGPARSLANQKGFPTSNLVFSKKISDPETTVYPSRIVYQMTDDPVSLYVVSFRTADKPDHVKLLKIEGPGKGRWFEIPLARSTDEKGKVIPGLMTDFMVVPQASTSLVWWYVGEIAPVFEGQNQPNYERLTPNGISVAFRVVQKGIEEIPSDASGITTGNIKTVISTAAASLVTLIYALDSVSAAYDTSSIGFKAYKEYLKVGIDLLKLVRGIIDASFEIANDASKLPELSKQIAALQNEAARREALHVAYLSRAETLTVWDLAVNLGTAQDVWSTMRTLMGELVGLIHGKKAELIRQGHAEEDLASIQALASAYVTRYDNSNDGFWKEARAFFNARNGQIDSVYDVVFSAPVFLKANLDVISRELESVKTPGAAPAAGIFAYLSGLGAEPVNLSRALNEIRSASDRLVDYKGRGNAVISRRGEALSSIETAVKLIVRGMGTKGQYLIDKGVEPVRDILLEIGRFRKQHEEAVEKVKKAKKKHDDLLANDPRSQNIETKNAESDLTQLKAQADGIKEQIKNNEKMITEDPQNKGWKNYPEPRFLEHWLNVMDPVFKLTATSTTTEKIAANLAVLTTLTKDNTFIRTFLVDSQAAVAKFMFSYRFEPINTRSWYELVTTAASNLDPNLTYDKLLKRAVFEIENIAKELLVSPSTLLTQARDVVGAENGTDFLSTASIDHTFKDYQAKAGKPSHDAIRTKVGEAAAWENFRKQLVEGRSSDREANTARLERMIAAQNRAVQTGRTSVWSRTDWEAMRAQLDIMAGFYGEPVGDQPPATAYTHEQKVVVDLMNPEGTLGKRLAVYADGRARQDRLRKYYNSLKDRIPRISTSFGTIYADYEAKKVPSEDGKTELTEEKQRELLDSFRDLVNEFEAFSKERVEAETIARGWEPVRKFFGKAWTIFYDWCNLPNGPGVRMMKELKEGGPVMQALSAIPGFLVLMLQLGTVVSLVSLTGIPAVVLVKQLLNGFLGTANGVFGGDPGQSANPPAAGKPSGSILPLLGFAAAIAMITSGKTVFDAISKTVGGFFQFATALMPGAKKRGAKGAPGGPGGGRRGPKVVVEDWLERLEAAQRRLEKAKAEGDKGDERIAKREIEKAIEKLKKAKEEGEDVPEGVLNLWGFNWLK